MILRKIGEGIRRQDWFVVFIDILIVVFGVYIGIWLGNIQAARLQNAETNQALVALRSELQSDLVRLDEIIAIQTKRVSDQDRMISLWSGDEGDDGSVAVILQTWLKDNSTFFPNKSAYSTMQNGGYLASLPDETLRLAITRLFEREYARQDINAAIYDELNFDFANSNLATYWDRVNGKPLGDPDIARVILRNGMIAIRDQGQFYLDFVSTQIRPGIVETLNMIDLYQNENDVR